MLYKDKIEALPMDDSTKIELRQFMYDLIRRRQPGICVEVGTHKGVTSLWIAEALRDNGRGMLYTVDPTDYGLVKLLDAFPELKPYINYQQAKGVDVYIPGIDFLFIDGFHEYEVVRDEIKHFLPLLSHRAHVLFHDCGGDNALVGVNRAIEDAGLQTELMDFGGSKSRLYIHENISLNS